MKKSNTECDATTQIMRCLICGDEVPLPLGVVDWVADVLVAFDRAHRNCKGLKGRTRFAPDPRVQALVDAAENIKLAYEGRDELAHIEGLAELRAALEAWRKA